MPQMNFRNWSIFANLRWQRIHRILHLDLQKERSILKASFIYSYIVLRMWKASPNNVCSQYFPGFPNSTSVWAQTVVSRIDPQIMLLFTKIVLDLITHFFITEEFQCKCQRQDSSLWPLSKYFPVFVSRDFPSLLFVGLINRWWQNISWGQRASSSEVKDNDDKQRFV